MQSTAFPIQVDYSLNFEEGINLGGIEFNVKLKDLVAQNLGVRSTLAEGHAAWNSMKRSVTLGNSETIKKIGSWFAGVGQKFLASWFFVNRANHRSVNRGRNGLRRDLYRPRKWAVIPLATAATVGSAALAWRSAGSAVPLLIGAWAIMGLALHGSIGNFAVKSDQGLSESHAKSKAKSTQVASIAFGSLAAVHTGIGATVLTKAVINLTTSLASGNAAACVSALGSMGAAAGVMLALGAVCYRLARATATRGEYTAMLDAALGEDKSPEALIRFFKTGAGEKILAAANESKNSELLNEIAPWFQQHELSDELLRFLKIEANDVYCKVVAEAKTKVSSTELQGMTTYLNQVKVPTIEMLQQIVGVPKYKQAGQGGLNGPTFNLVVSTLISLRDQLDILLNEVRPMVKEHGDAIRQAQDGKAALERVAIVDRNQSLTQLRQLRTQLNTIIRNKVLGLGAQEMAKKPAFKCLYDRYREPEETVAAFSERTGITVESLRSMELRTYADLRLGSVLRAAEVIGQRQEEQEKAEVARELKSRAEDLLSEHLEKFLRTKGGKSAEATAAVKELRRLFDLDPGESCLVEYHAETKWTWDRFQRALGYMDDMQFKGQHLGVELGADQTQKVWWAIRDLLCAKDAPLDPDSLKEVQARLTGFERNLEAKRAQKKPTFTVPVAEEPVVPENETRAQKVKRVAFQVAYYGTRVALVFIPVLVSPTLAAVGLVAALAWRMSDDQQRTNFVNTVQAYIHPAVGLEFVKPWWFDRKVSDIKRDEVNALYAKGPAAWGRHLWMQSAATSMLLAIPLFGGAALSGDVEWVANKISNQWLPRVKRTLSDPVQKVSQATLRVIHGVHWLATAERSEVTGYMKEVITSKASQLSKRVTQWKDRRVSAIASRLLPPLPC